MDQTLPPAVANIDKKLYTGIALRLLNLLGTGTVNQEQAAKAVGVSVSYVSQLCGEENFQLQIAEKIQKEVEQAIAVDKDYNETEKLLAKKLREVVPFINSPSEVIKALEFVNKARRRTSVGTTGQPGANGTGVTINQSVKLVLPAIVKQTFVLNPNNEVVGVDNRELVTLDSKQLESIVKEKNAQPPKLPAPKRHENTDIWSNL